MDAGSTLADLARRLRGRVHLPPIPDRFRTDYGGYRSGSPDAVVEAICEDDVRAVLATARAHGLPVTVRGAGHSSNGRLAVAQGGILLVNCRSEGADVSLGVDGVADIEARACWDAVERRLNSEGRAAPVLPDTLSLSVGGTVSVGGYGVRSVRGGAQVDNVVSLRLVLPDGTARDVSPTGDPELFRFALAGLGSVGVIERVRLATRPKPGASRVYVSIAPSWQVLLDALCKIPEMAGGEGFADLPMELMATLHPGGEGYMRRRYYFPDCRGADAHPSPRLPLLPVAFAGDATESACFADARDVDAWLAPFAGRRKVWADYLLDPGAFRSFMAEVEVRVRSGHPAVRYLPSVYLLAIRRPASGGAPIPLSPTAGGPEGRWRLGCGLYNMVPHDDGPAVAAAIAGCEELTDLCIALGGRPYLHGVATMSGERRREVYGADYDRLLALRRDLDPQGLYNTGWFA